MFFRNAPVEIGDPFHPLLPQKNVVQMRRQQRRLSYMPTIRVAFAIACVLTVAVWRLRAIFKSGAADACSGTIGGFESHGTRTSSRGTYDAESNNAAVSSRPLSFQVCNGFANQRLLIIYAAIIAKETGRSLCLPKLLLDGTKNETSKAATLIKSDRTTFSTFYDVEVFARGMKAAGVRVLDKDFTLSSTSDKVVRVPSQDHYRSTAHLSVECPLFKLDAAVVSRHREVVESVLSSLVPAPTQKAKIEELKRALSNSGHYNFLHLRVERDWIKHCETWVSDRGVCLAEKVVRAIGEHLDLKGVPRGTPLHVACDLPTAEPDLLNAAIKSLKAMGYQKVTLQEGRQKKEKSEVGRKGSGSELSRDLRAMHAYYLGMDSAKYIGNSVSTVSALILLERRNLNRWSTYYNMGGIPLMDILPFFRMPWVFTYNGESPAFDYMAKSAVLSAIHVGKVIPYCIYMGDKVDAMYQWLKRQGVHVVLHDPSWKVKIVQKYDEAKEFAKTAATYESITSLVATFMRFDIPIVHALYQYNYVLYTDVDVLFLKKVDLHSFPPELPEAMAMAHEVDYKFPCNAGVVLYNLPYMRQSHMDLVNFAMHAPGLHFGEYYGPADQGALNQFYERELRSECNLPEAFNAKPYKLGDFDGIDDIFILHFHGPKPKHYLEFADSRGCGPYLDAVGGGDFVTLCEKGLKNLCEIHLEIPESMHSQGSWGPLRDLKTNRCKKRFRQP